MGKRLGAGVVLAAAAAAAVPWLLKRNSIPGHLLGHPVAVVDQLLTPAEADGLMQLSKEMREFPTNTDSLKFYATRHEHVGEAVPIGADGKCDHPFLVPSVNRTHCVLAGRIDIGRHFLTHGGVDGVKEPFELSVSRLLSFGRYMFDLEKYPAVEALFKADKFQAAAKTVCPPGQQYLRPFQFNFIVNVPGQSVAMHVDSVYFWGASRFQFPEWLLAAMQFSGLWQDRFVHQVQVVAYYHRWNTTGREGKFTYWDSEGAPAYVDPTPLAGTIVDGSKTVHAAGIYRGDPPIFDKSKPSSLRYIGDEKWELVSGGEVLRTYDTDDLRMTIVYRGKCHADAATADRFDRQVMTQDESEDGQITLEEVLDTFRGDLRRRGLMGAEEPSRLDLALLILGTYVKYPLPPDAVIPYNYCMLSKLRPALKPLMSVVC